MMVEQSQLVDKYRPKSEACAVDLALRGNLPMYIEDALEVFIEVLIGQELRSLWKMRLTSTPHTVGVRVGATFGGDQKPLCLLAFLAYVLGVVMGVSQHEAHLTGSPLMSELSLVVCYVGRGEPS